MIQIRPYVETDEEAVARLWREVFPDAPAWNRPESDIARKLSVQRELFLVATLDEELEQIPLSCSGSLRTATGSRPGSPRGLNPAARDASSRNALVGTAMGGYDGHRGWVYYVAVSPQKRRQGIGRTLMRRIEEELKRLGCPKLNLQVRASNHEVVAFYESLGYQVEERASMGKRLTK